ncbi:hypothetical protein CEXT_662371 [Caerostris extrusa]|uniref:Uncharacterized protein n=1 Tax=Caerostris extrusa TaxID=172846 RepID=A0AAV4N968_CAEEX|nr:hypothetical protein CEXT_662371 [Caerostris extrusa]
MIRHVKTNPYVRSNGPIRHKSYDLVRDLFKLHRIYNLAIRNHPPTRGSYCWQLPVRKRKGSFQSHQPIPKQKRGWGWKGHGTLNPKGPVLLSRLSGAHFKEGPANHISISAPERKAFGESPLGRLADDRDKGASPPTGAGPGVASR